MQQNVSGMISPDSYGIPIEICPIEGMATHADWKYFVEGSALYPGRNHPKVGAWIIEKFAGLCEIGFDPMCGVGGLWRNSKSLNLFSECVFTDIDERAVSLCTQNMEPRSNEVPNGIYYGIANIADPEFSYPFKNSPSFIMFSPPFRQNKTAGRGNRQREIVNNKKIHIVEEFSNIPTNKQDFYQMMHHVYHNLKVSSSNDARMFVILRNFIRNSIEIDEVGAHLKTIQRCGWNVKMLHIRDLKRPTAFQAWKLAKDPGMPWIRYEYIVEVDKSA